MRKINLKNYTVRGYNRKKDEMEDVPYLVKDSIINILLATGEITKQRLDKASLLRNHLIAQKIENAKNFVLLEESEFNIIDRAFESFQGFGKNEVELCLRIDEAKKKTVDVKEKGKKNK